ncbi:MAG: hypothetical protein ACYTDY_03485 [Planctomycetota bacterium]|jgi:hypothetical protein
MVRVDLNRISIVGLIMGGAAIILLLLDSRAEQDWTVATVLGPDAPLAGYSLWMILAVGSIIVYLTGRLIHLARNRFGMPPPPPPRDMNQ